MNNSNLENNIERLQKELKSLKIGIEELIKTVDRQIKAIEDYSKSVNLLVDAVEDLITVVSDLNQTVKELVIVVLDSLRKLFTRIILESISHKDKILHIHEEYQINNHIIPTLIECTDKVYVLDLKIKPLIKDIEEFANTIKDLKAKYKNKKIIPILILLVSDRRIRKLCKKLNILTM